MKYLKALALLAAVAMGLLLMFAWVSFSLAMPNPWSAVLLTAPPSILVVILLADAVEVVWPSK